MADSVASGGAVHLYDTGHIIDSEMYNRAGGLVLMRRFRYNLNVENSTFERDYGDKNTSMEGLAEYALRAGKVKTGDIMLIGSCLVRMESYGLARVNARSLILRKICNPI